MINASDLLTRIKMDLGIYALKLPFENPDKALMDVIRLKTLKVFSIYQPFVTEISVDLERELEAIKTDYTESCYILPDLGQEYVSVRAVKPKSKLLGGGYVTPVFDGSINTYNALMMTQANADLASIAAPPITFKFEAPNKLYLYNFATMYGKMDLVVGLTHAENLSTIPFTASESFYDLAFLDIKQFLYNALKHYRELQSAYGTVSLQIDDWSNAESERRDLIEKWRDTYHLDTTNWHII